jgi:predicted nucleotidyltransferase
LVCPLHDLVNWLKARGTPFVIVGGAAASLQGRPRATRDLDGVILLGEDDWSGFVADAQVHGFVGRIPDPVGFARKSRVLLLRHAGRGVDVDLALGVLPFEREMVDRRQHTDVEGVEVPLATPEDLIVMKSLAMRPQDISDIESLLDAHEIDVTRVRFWVRQFSEALESPEIEAQVEQLLRRRGL